MAPGPPGYLQGPSSNPFNVRPRFGGPTLSLQGHMPQSFPSCFGPRPPMPFCPSYRQPHHPSDAYSNPPMQRCFNENFDQKHNDLDAAVDYEEESGLNTMEKPSSAPLVPHTNPEAPIPVFCCEFIQMHAYSNFIRKVLLFCSYVRLLFHFMN